MRMVPANNPELGVITFQRLVDRIPGPLRKGNMCARFARRRATNGRQHMDERTFVILADFARQHPANLQLERFLCMRNQVRVSTPLEGNAQSHVRISRPRKLPPNWLSAFTT